MTQRNSKKVNDASASEPLVSRVVKLRLVGKRLDQFLALEFPLLSREKLKLSIREKTFLVDGLPTDRPDLRLALGMEIAWPPSWERRSGREKEEETSREALPKVQALGETEDFLVLNKPAGLSMHPTGKQEKNTLTEWLSTSYPQIMGIGEAKERPGMVHRLDKDTSGVVLIAKTEAAFKALKSLFQARTIQKEYLALVYGNLQVPSGSIQKPIGRVKGSKKRATPEGKRAFGGELRDAETEFALHTRYPQYDLLALQPKTGRTHQIRVHLASLGHPIVGDRLYRFKEHRKDRLVPPYQLLHAAKITFRLFGKRYRFEAPLPDYFADTLSLLSLEKGDRVSS